MPEALQSRRPLKWGRSLLHTYLEHFTPEDTLFQKLAQSARRFFQDKRVMDALLETQAGGLTRLITTLDILDPINGPIQVANDLLTMPPERTLLQWQELHALTRGFWLNNFCRQAFAEALKAPEDVRSTLPYIERMCEWAMHDADTPTQRFRYPIWRDEFAYALLSPWFEKSPSQEIKNFLLTKLLSMLGDLSLIHI